MENEHDDFDMMSPEERHSYNVLQTLIVFLDNMFCIIFVLCITFLVWKLDRWSLMWFYLLPVFAYTAV